MIIGLVGPKGSGKSTIARMMVEMGSWEELSFASILKDVAALLSGVDRDLFDDPHAKEEYIVNRVGVNGAFDPGTGVSIRKIMQLCGSMFKSVFGPGVFIRALHRSIQQSAYQNIVISDVRFPEEADFITQVLSGILIRVSRHSGDSSVQDDHVSEVQHKSIVCSEVFHNGADMNLGDLERLVHERFTNVCIICFTSLGLQNPRQLCGKTYCYNT